MGAQIGVRLLSSQTQTLTTESSSQTRLVEHLRLTAFLHPDERPTEPAWWSEVTGAQPEQRISKPARGELQDSGLIGTATLSVSLQPGRVDWFISPGPLEATIDLVAAINSVGPFPDQFGEFTSMMERWLGSAPRVLRMAFGAVVLEQVPSKEAGYRKLAEYLRGVNIDPTGSEDLLYQINRPRPSRGMPNLRLNRLSKWSVAYFQKLRVGLAASPAVQPQLGDRVHACRIELDINTPAEFSEVLPSSNLSQLFRELSDLGAEIVSKGDIA